ncbi:hypothetical protein Cantr_06009 [Candida viswanathii]|uniref:Uncharacterized protein n=1 Tax=Candida viswanathii TaxID=5486 RepID=A0A367XUP3_9ASCO|nr:hypothetical protein Cantr_06009 [Candida viswanathii]
MLQSSPDFKKPKDKKSWKDFLKTKNGTKNDTTTISPKRTISSRDTITGPLLSTPILARTPSLGNTISTPSTTPASATYSSPRPEKIPTRDPFADIDLGLNISFANILSSNKQGALPEVIEDDSKEKCFICEELLSSVLKAERIVKLNCGDLVHCECFKAYFSDEIPLVHESYTSGQTITFGKNCKGAKCNNTRKVVLDTGNWNLISTRKLSLIPKRPAPHPKTHSVNLTALKSTLDGQDVSLYPSMRRRTRASLRSSGVGFSTRSPSPDPTISTVTTDTDYDVVDAETIRNKLIRFLLDNCANVNLSKLFQLGHLRVADELSVCIEPMDYFETRYVYLFENCMVIWNKTEDPVFVPVKEIQISSRGAILQVYQKGPATPNSTLLQSTSSAIVEKWVVAVSDTNLQLPGNVITSSINTDHEDTKSESVPSTIKYAMSEYSHDGDSDSDVDSDAEAIQEALNKDTVTKWEELIIEIDNALVTN